MEDGGRTDRVDADPAQAETGAGAPCLTLGALRPLPAIMAAANLVPEQVLAQAGLPGDLFAGADAAPVALADYFRLCEQMALQGDDESCQVSLRPLMAGTSELVQARLRGCRTLAQLLEVVAGSYNILHGHRYNRVERRRGGIAYVIDDTDFPYALGREAPFVLLSLECLLVYVHVLVLSCLPEGAGPALRQVETRAPAPDGAKLEIVSPDGAQLETSPDGAQPKIVSPNGAKPDMASPDGAAGDGGGAGAARGTPLRYWGVPIRHGAGRFALVYGGDADGIAVCPDRSPVLAARTLYGGVADMLDRLRPPRRAESLADRVARLIADGLAGAGWADQVAVAGRLGISVATLRRALEAEGTRFRDVRARVLNRAAQAALREGCPVADVAERLAFSDGRSFARAFRQWNGISPADFARRLRRSDPVSEIVP